MASLLSVGQLVDRTLDHCKTHFKELLSIVLWIVIASTLTGAGKLVSLFVNNPEVTAGDWTIIIFGILGTLSVAVVSMWAYIVLILATAEQSSGKNINLKKIYQAGWKHWLQYFLLSAVIALLFVAMAALSLPGIVLLFTSAIKASSILATLGLPLLFAGGVLSLYSLLKYSIPLAFAPYILLLEKRSIIDSIKDSLQLVKGRWLATFIRFVLPKFIYTLVFVVLSYVVFALMQVLFLAVAGTSDFFIAIVYAINFFLSVFISVTVTPLIVANDYYLYDSLRRTR